MIDDLSKTLRAILTQKALPPELAKAQIAFDHPSEEFNPQQTTVDLFLYDIREDLELRSNEPVIERKNGEVITRHPPLRVACSYLVTAWPVGGVDSALQEQRLLGQVLQVFARLPIIPKSFLQGSLKGQTPALPMITAVVDPQKNLSEFWTALGSQLRPSLTITVTFSMPSLEPETAKAVVTEEISLGRRTAPDEEEIMQSSSEEFIRIGIFGRVTDATQAPVAGATVAVDELGLIAKTDSEGRYKLILKQPGAYILRVQKGAKQSEAKIEAKAGLEQNLRLN
jgi:Pvc16 N-terminal domain/Carboxypeptidase regulatory-like domain